MIAFCNLNWTSVPTGAYRSQQKKTSRARERFFVLFFAVFCDIGKISVIFSAVKAVADDEMIGYRKEREVGLKLDDAAGGLVKQGYNVKRNRLS